MQEFVPERHVVVKDTDLSEEQRKENKGDDAEIECEGKIDAVALFYHRRCKHEEQNKKGASGGGPVLVPDENPDRHQY